MTGEQTVRDIPESRRLGGESAAGILARVDRLLSLAVQTVSAGSGPDPFRGLYLSDAAAAHLVSRGPGPLGPGLAFDRPLVDVEQAGPRWQRLAAAFSLAPVETDVLALALAPELDLRYERVFGYLHDDLTKRRLTPDLASHLLCASFEERLAARHLFAPEAPLLRYGLVHLSADPSQPFGPVSSHAVNLDEGLVEFLLGGHRIDRRLAEAVRWDGAAPGPLPAEAEATLPRLVRGLQTPRHAAPHVVMLGPNPAGKLEIARHAARAVERPLLVIDLARAANLDVSLARAALLVARTARLFDALTFWTGGETLVAGADVEGAAGSAARARQWEAWLSGMDALETTGVLLALPALDPLWPVEIADRFLSIAFAVPDAGQRQGIWSQHLAARGIAIATTDAALLAEVFQLDAEAIGRAVGHAVTRARWRDQERPAVTREDLVAAARSQLTRALPRYATRIQAVHRWEDLVLPADQLEQLRELCHYVRHRHRVLDEWGFGRRLALGRGVAALFSGPSGTGKTMAAQIIGDTLGLDVYRVEIPAVVSKYIGDTEKALDRLFHEAQGTSVILFFDEADALFGKRSEVRDAHDRYANIETSYLLQALEQFEGLTILATNFRHNMDDAFVRRLAFTITFPFPEEAERGRLWRRCWPEEVPLDADLDVDFLARQFKLSGGNIRNVALAAAFAAAANGGRVTMTHVIRGVRREYQKMGKVCAESDFGPYFAALAGEGER